MLTQAENDLLKSALGSSGWRGQLANEPPSPWEWLPSSLLLCYWTQDDKAFIAVTTVSMETGCWCCFFTVIASSEPSQDARIWLAIPGLMPILPYSLFSQETGEHIFPFSRLQNETQENWILNWCRADLLNAHISELDTEHYANCIKCDLTGPLTSSFICLI